MTPLRKVVYSIIKMENSLDQNMQSQPSMQQPLNQPSVMVSNSGEKKSSFGMLFAGVMLAIVILLGGAALYKSFYKNKLPSKESTQMQSKLSSETSIASNKSELDVDAQNIDTKLNEITNYESNVDQGLNDQQVDLNQ